MIQLKKKNLKMLEESFTQIRVKLDQKKTHPSLQGIRELNNMMTNYFNNIQFSSIKHESDLDKARKIIYED